MDFKSGMKYLYSNKQAQVVYFTQLFIYLIWMTVPVLLAPFAKNILHATSSEFGQIEATLTMGMVFGGILITYFAQKLGFKIIIAVSAFLLGVGLLLFSMVNTLLFALILYLLVGFSLGCWSLIMTKAQEVTDLDYQGRVFFVVHV